LLFIDNNVSILSVRKERIEHFKLIACCLIRTYIDTLVDVLKYAIRLADVYDAVKEGVETNVTFGDVAQNITLMQTLGEINNFETPGKYNDMQKEKVSYYIIESDDLSELKSLCAEHFNTV
jgi:hypothetical protein